MHFCFSLPFCFHFFSFSNLFILLFPLTLSYILHSCMCVYQNTNARLYLTTQHAENLINQTKDSTSVYLFYFFRSVSCFPNLLLYTSLFLWVQHTNLSSVCNNNPVCLIFLPTHLNC
ncbi:hypothetical protein XELAEV_18015235mg [Xenopus laevis]|uniref:Uncharacterized protein n=1 Tax=Xenopus laevis TaxID=8355 RepID=A0A974HVY3_XENLA|nr:hypothetical protein XELAEV_18015235mg [Xenopus laevis]